MCWVLGHGCLSMEAWGFWWATWAAAGGKSLSPRAMAPEMNTVGLGGLEDKEGKDIEHLDSQERNTQAM